MITIQKDFQFKSPFGNLFWLAVGFIIACFLFLLIESAGLKKGYYTLTIFCFTILLAYYFGYRQRYQLQLTNIFLGILLCLFIILLYELALTYIRIPEWDFLCLYLFGKVGISGSEFYNPQVFSQFFNDLHLQNRTDDNYRAVIVNVGFWYPPPSMFFFLPLGLFSMKAGYIFWQTLISIFLTIDIFLLCKYFAPVKNILRKREFKDFLPLLLIFDFPHVTASIQYSQTISLFLFFLFLLMSISTHLSYYMLRFFSAYL